MSFLAPFALLLGLAAALPLWLHLRRRKVEMRLDFPAVRYLLRAEQEHARELKVRNVLLMALRVAIVLLLALAAARPLARLGVGGHGPTALAVVLDNSMSTGAVVGGRPVLAGLQEAAHAVLERARSSDRLWVVTADGAVTGGAASVVGAAVDHITSGAGAGDLPAAVRTAAALASGAGLPAARVVVVTDGQASAWPAQLPRPSAPLLLYAPGTPPPANRAVTRAVADPPHWAPRGVVRATVLARDAVTWRAALGSTTLARGTVAGGGTIEAAAAPAARGWTSGVIELPPDELRADDARPFALHVGPAPAARVDASAGAFARTALAALAADGRVREGNGVTVAGAESGTALPALLTAPSDPARVALANRALERARIPWRFGERRAGPVPMRGDGLDGASALRYYALERVGAAPSDTLARVGVEPVIVAGEGWVLTAFALDPADTDLPVRAPFLPWLDRTIARRLAADAGPVIDTSPLAWIARPAWATGLEAPDGTVLALDGARFRASAAGGVYFLRRGAERAGAVVVAAESGESVLERASAASIASRFAGGEASGTDDVARIAARAWSDKSPRPILAALLLAVLALLALETWVSRRDAAETG
ncbi:MAG TPA: BatA domain-containing protein [Gemmatimonadaceae bacterium]